MDNKNCRAGKCFQYIFRFDNFISTSYMAKGRFLKTEWSLKIIYYMFRNDFFLFMIGSANFANIQHMWLTKMFKRYKYMFLMMKPNIVWNY